MRVCRYVSYVYLYICLFFTHLCVESARHQDWEKMLPEKSLEVRVRQLHTSTSFVMQQVLSAVTPMTSKDLLVVSRGSSVEIWTNRDFPAMSLVLAPECSEIKDKYWTAGRSVMAKNGSALHPGPGKKHVVLDGRLRGGVNQDRVFSPFFAVTRDSDAKKTNMITDYVKTTIGAEVNKGRNVYMVGARRA